MTLQEYKDKILSIGFEEHPRVSFDGEPALKDLVDYDAADLDLKIHLVEVIPSPG